MSTEIEIVPKGTLVRRMIASVAREHGLTFDDIMSASQSRRIVTARTAAIKMVKANFSDLSLPQIGRIFNRDHTTILHALRKPDAAS